VAASFSCDARFQGYPDRLHGGVIAMLMDAAMVHWLFGQQLSGATAKLEVQYRHPVLLNRDATVRARLVRDAHPLYVLEAEVLQQDVVQAQARGLFSVKDVAAPDGDVTLEPATGRKQGGGGP
jgi:acyl-coenzyme A thioesterase PaaI-like protein